MGRDRHASETVRIAEEANRAVTEVDDEPRGTLRVTADPMSGTPSSASS